MAVLLGYPESIHEKSYSSVDLKYISYIHRGMKQNLKVNGLDKRYTKFEMCKIDVC
jgi:hypothetical protein